MSRSNSSCCRSPLGYACSAKSDLVDVWDMSADLALDRPDGLDGPAWASIDENRSRLQRACASQDWPQAIGSAKELVEATAKVVLDARGTTPPSELDYIEALNEAHKALERQPGPGLASDEDIRNVASAMLKIAKSIREPRNRYGTGHGRAVPAAPPEEVVHVVVDAAMVWCRWALRRLAHLIAGEPNGLARDLNDMTLGRFHRGTLSARLEAADLPHMQPPDQFLLGVAVAHRAMNGTFTVAEEGVEACAESMDLTTWPVGYRLGLSEGMFLNRAGYVHPSVYSVQHAAKVLAPMSGTGLGLWIQALSTKIGQATLTHQLSDPHERTRVVDAMTRTVHRFRDAQDKQAWLVIAGQLSPQ